MKNFVLNMVYIVSLLLKISVSLPRIDLSHFKHKMQYNTSAIKWPRLIVKKWKKFPFTKKVCKNQLHRHYNSISSKVRDSKTQSQIQSNSVITITVIANSRL
jgi:hypothetical protein